MIIKKSKLSVDIFVNNAGVNGGKKFPETTEEEYDLVLDTYNLVKNDELLSKDISIPTNNDMNASENTTIPGAKYFNSN